MFAVTEISVSAMRSCGLAGMRRIMAVLWVAVFFFACSFGRAESNEKYRIGAILPLSGESANSGAACRNGVLLALDELEAGVRARLEVVIEDDRNIARDTLSAFNKLAGGGPVDAVVTFFSNTSKALAPITEAKKIPMIAIASDPEVSRGRRYAVNLWVTPEEEMKALLSRARCLGYRRIARITAIQPGLLTFKRIYDENRERAPEVVLDEEYPADVNDFRVFLSRVRAAGNIDAVFVNMMFMQAGLLAKQARELGITLPLFAIEVFEDPAAVKASNGALVGQWYIQADDPSGDFLARYARRFPDESSYTAANCYDAVGLVAAAMRAGVARHEINRFLAGVKDFQGALGRYSVGEDNRFILPAVAKVVTKDGFQRIAPDQDVCLKGPGRS